MRDVPPNARSALANGQEDDMADMRRCIGSTKFGIKAHDAPPSEFPVQISQKDGLGRMCKPHWREYTRALRAAALARKAAAAGDGTVPRTIREAIDATLTARSPAIRAVPKPAKKPKQRREQARANKVRGQLGRLLRADGEQVDEAIEADVAFAREREAELGRAAQASDAARAAANVEEASTT